VFPSPKFHAHDVGVPVDVSVNVTDNGASPDDTDDVNDAVGAVGGCDAELLYTFASSPLNCASDFVVVVGDALEL
jgi:hypothetical protein